MEDRKPTGWLESVVLAGSDEHVRVTLQERQGSRLLFRQVDPGEPEPARVPIYDGDELVVMQAISHLSVHTSGEAGDASGFLFAYRVVPARREPGVVYARTLRRKRRTSANVSMCAPVRRSGSKPALWSPNSSISTHSNRVAGRDMCPSLPSCGPGCHYDHVKPRPPGCDTSSRPHVASTQRTSC